MSNAVPRVEEAARKRTSTALSAMLRRASRRKASEVLAVSFASSAAVVPVGAASWPRSHTGAHGPHLPSVPKYIVQYSHTTASNFGVFLTPPFMAAIQMEMKFTAGGAAAGASGGSSSLSSSFSSSSAMSPSGASSPSPE